MAKTADLGQPTDSHIIYGRNSLARYHLINSSVATGISPTNIEGLQDIQIGGLTYGTVDKTFQYGGSRSREKRMYPEQTGSIKMLGGALKAFMKAINGDTSVFGAPLTFPAYPVIHLQAILRDLDNETEMQTALVPNVIFENPDFPIPDGKAIVTINWKSEYPAILVDNAYSVVYDLFNTDGSSTQFTPSDTPVDWTTVATEGREMFDYDDMILVGVKASGDNEFEPNQECTITPGTPEVAFDTAPANSGVVGLLYLAAD